MSPTPTVSVILPTRNRGSRIARAVESVLAQDIDLELIVIDDGSTDDTAASLGQLADQRTSLIRLTPGRGAAAARNVGLAEVRAPTVAFQDSDTWWPPGRLRTHVDALASAPAETAVVYGDSLLHGDRGTRCTPGQADRLRSGDLSATLLRYNIIDLPGSLVRRRVLDEVGGFDARLPRLQDWDLFLSIALKYHLLYVPGVAVESDDSDDRISTHRDAYYAALEQLLIKHHAMFTRSHPCHVAHHNQLMRYALSVRQPGRALRHVMQAVRFPGEATRQVAQRLAGRPSPIARPEELGP